MTDQSEDSRRRPIGVWVISAFYVLSASWTLLSFALILSGAVSMDTSRQMYFESLSIFDWLFTLAIAAAGTCAAVTLFLLRRISFSLFVLAFLLNLAYSAYQALATDWLETVRDPNLAGMLLAVIVMVAVLVYTRGLVRRGVLS